MFEDKKNKDNINKKKYIFPFELYIYFVYLSFFN